MQLYNINWLRLIAWLLPNELRKIKILKYLFALIEPLNIGFSQFKQFRLQQIYESEINGQTIKLERALNDEFDSVLRRIYITDGSTFDPPVFYEEWKPDKVEFYIEGNTDNPIFYSFENIDNIITFNFFVHLSSDIWADRLRIKALVNKYKVFGRTFEVVLIE